MGYPGAGLLPKITDHDLKNAPASDWLVTFRSFEGSHSSSVIRKYSAIKRVAPPAGVKDITLYCIESDTPLSATLFWDIAHGAAVGAAIHVVEQGQADRYFDREYFQGALVAETRSGSLTTYRKVRALDAEAGSLDEWTFGIPTGPEDATLLNTCVARILELDIPRKEIILCGRPADNFKYWDYVRIVGEDITAPPVQICKKKNRIVNEATFENLCIIHDRVFLPKNFREMVTKFGNAFPMTAVQSLYFDDRHNFSIRRYSDAGVGLRLKSHVSEGLSRAATAETSRYSQSVFSKIEKTGFIFANAHRHSDATYPTGSLYLCKRSVWQRVPQDERLLWAEFEDIEQGERAARAGIPTMINPYGVTQSIISRPILAWLGAAICERTAGGEQMYRSIFEHLTWIPRKPLIKKTQESAARDYQRFMKTWGVEPDPSIEPITSAVMTMKRRLRWMVQVTHAVKMPLKRERIVAFLKDFERLVVSEQVPYSWHQDAADAFERGGERGIDFMLAACTEVFNHAAQRPKGRIFAKSLEDYMPTSAWTVIAGSVASAVFLMRNNNRFMTLPSGFFWKLKAILGSTPFLRYAKEKITPVGEIVSKGASA